MAHHGGSELPGYQGIGERLAAEFANVHSSDTVTRCVAAARHGAADIIGFTTPDLVERIARKHLQVLAMVAAERRQQIRLGH